MAQWTAEVTCCTPPTTLTSRSPCTLPASQNPALGPPTAGLPSPSHHAGIPAPSQRLTREPHLAPQCHRPGAPSGKCNHLGASSPGQGPHPALRSLAPGPQPRPQRDPRLKGAGGPGLPMHPAKRLLLPGPHPPPMASYDPSSPPSHGPRPLPLPLALAGAWSPSAWRPLVATNTRRGRRGYYGGGASRGKRRGRGTAGSSKEWVLHTVVRVAASGAAPPPGGHMRRCLRQPPSVTAPGHAGPLRIRALGEGGSVSSSP